MKYSICYCYDNGKWVLDIESFRNLFDRLQELACNRHIRHIGYSEIIETDFGSFISENIIMVKGSMHEIRACVKQLKEGN